MKKTCLLFLCVLLISGTLVGCASNESAKIAPLTEEELEYFNGDDFFNGEPINIRNQFLSSLYSTPENINLFELFYCGSGLEEALTETELAAVIAYNGWEQTPDCGCTKISRANMDAVLTEYMGLTLADTEKIGLENFTYLEEYDAYYFYHGDTNYRGMATLFSSGEREGNTIRLFYSDQFMADGDKVLTLKAQGTGYLFVSNQKSDDNLPESSEPTTSATGTVLVNVDYATDELLSEYDSFDEFTEFEDEGYQKIIFITNIVVKDFRFIEVGYKEENTNIVFFENKVSYSLDELSPEKPLVVTWMEQGSIPHRGISFIDENNTTRYFYVAMSGEDGSLFLVEFL